MHGRVKFYRGAASAARSYVEADRSRVDDYYLAEGTGVAERYVATSPWDAGGRGVPAVQDGGRWTETPTSGGSPATTCRPAQLRDGCATTPVRCGSLKWW